MASRQDRAKKAAYDLVQDWYDLTFRIQNRMASFGITDGGLGDLQEEGLGVADPDGKLEQRLEKHLMEMSDIFEKLLERLQ